MKKGIFSYKRIVALLSAVLLSFTVFATSIPASAQTDGHTLTFSRVNPLYADMAVVQPLLSAAQPLEQAVTFHNLTEAGVALREGMKKRESTVHVGYVVDEDELTSQQFQQYADDIFDEAVKHTGVPTEGDYLLWHYHAYDGGLTWYAQDGKTYITYTYNFIYWSTPLQEQETDVAVENLLRDLDIDAATDTDYDKVRAIYDYICENVTYDTAGLAAGRDEVYTAYAAAVKHQAVCQGYASLLYRLLLEVGVDSRLIAGQAGGGRHGWNIVELADKYYNADSTWDAGRTAYAYFLKAEENFGDHTRFDEYNTATFHAAHPMDTSDYVPDAGIQSGKTGDCTWTLDDGKLTISGNGAMADYQHFSELPWGTDITEVKIENGVTTIGDQAFRNCAFVTAVAIPDTVVSIGAYAFSGCTSLMSIELPAYMDTIENYAFFNCSALTDVWFGGSEWQVEDIDCGEGNDALQRAVWQYKRNEPQNRWMQLSGKWYYFEKNVMVKNAWRKDSKGWVKLGADGAMLTNKWTTDSKGWCYVGSDGYAVTNCWKKDSVGWIYLDANGSMTKSKWILSSGKWYYVDANGYMVTNKWMKDSKGWVKLGGDGAMLTNKWTTDSKGWCYVGKDGYAVTNCWKKDSKGWIWLDGNGSMTKSKWVKDGSSWYYCDASGYMVANKSMKIGNKTYHFNASGVCTNP